MTEIEGKTYTDLPVIATTQDFVPYIDLWPEYTPTSFIKSPTNPSVSPSPLVGVKSVTDGAIFTRPDPDLCYQQFILNPMTEYISGFTKEILMSETTGPTEALYLSDFFSFTDHTC